MHLSANFNCQAVKKGTGGKVRKTFSRYAEVIVYCSTQPVVSNINYKLHYTYWHAAAEKEVLPRLKENLTELKPGQMIDRLLGNKAMNSKHPSNF